MKEIQMTSPKNEWKQISMYNTHTWAEASKWKLRERRFLIPYLIPEAETILFLADPDVDVQTFANLLAFRTSLGLPVEPFTSPKASPVLAIYGPRQDLEQAMKTLHRIDKACACASSDVSNKDALGNFRFYHAEAEADEATYLDTSTGQAALLASIPKGCKLIVITDLATCLSPNVKDRDSSLSVLTEKLNSAGVAVAIFESALPRTSIGAQFVTKSSCIVRLMYDEAAPAELGGGFHLVRKKFDPYDTADVIPTRIQFWSTTLGGKLEWGWTFRDEQNQQSSKQVAIMERRIKVANLLAAKKEQKEIAALLDVHAATICRDVAAIQAQEGTPSVSPVPVEANPVANDGGLSALEEEWGARIGQTLAVDHAGLAPLPVEREAPPPQRRQTGRGVGMAPVNLKCDESIESELTAREHDQPHRMEATQRPRPARLANSAPLFFGARPSRRRPTRGVGTTPINRKGDESLDSELTSPDAPLPQSESHGQGGEGHQTSSNGSE